MEFASILLTFFSVALGALIIVVYFNKSEIDFQGPMGMYITGFAIFLVVGLIITSLQQADVLGAERFQQQRNERYVNY